MKKGEWQFSWQSRFDVILFMYITHLVDRWHPGFIDDNILVLALSLFVILGIDLKCLIYHKKD